MQEQGMRIETTRRRTPLTLALMAGAAAAFGPGPAAGQAGDPLLTATVSQRFEVDTNFGLDDPRPGTSYFADTRLALGLLQETPTQTFALGFNTGLRALWEAEEDFDLTFASPSTATAAYRPGVGDRGDRQPLPLPPAAGGLPPAARRVLRPRPRRDPHARRPLPAARATPPSGASTPGSASTSPRTRRAPTASASTPPGSTTAIPPPTARRATRSAATASGACG
jgi:hypothetical protein